MKIAILSVCVLVSSSCATVSPMPDVRTVVFNWSSIDCRSNPPNIPLKVRDGAKATLVAWVGREFFDRYVSLDSCGCDPRQAPLHGASGDTSLVIFMPRGPVAYAPRWAMKYKVSIPGKPWVSQPIHVYVDPEGAPFPGAVVDGIGNCVANPEECVFLVDGAKAAEIARAAGLKRGIGGWTASFHWVEKPERRYVWWVENTMSVGKDGCSTQGRRVVIDGITGRVIRSENSGVICD